METFSDLAPGAIEWSNLESGSNSLTVQFSSSDDLQGFEGTGGYAFDDQIYSAVSTGFDPGISRGVSVLYYASLLVLCCGGRMIVVETFEGPRPWRSPPPSRIRIDSS